ncbi:hypothetical protein SAMN04488515_0434 [Cognatiyoonia koreensis]|uniref:SPW repeat-containing protein n=1 Tax=Cognatiyoonia koreensis TaxID=364200 RepID=A0A1I0N6U1_9RHOB|nr:hypothetical protein [Cognatiyoonia koreensis]SEV96626.1 hypothetical protein SAMN04488515_0434 [Cognatiyoonia koreensis]
MGDRITVWPRIETAQTARQAVRMAGLPVFLFGLATAFSGLTFSDPATMLTQLGIGVVLIVFGFALRSHVAGLAPLAALFVIGSFAWSLWSAGAVLWLGLLYLPSLLLLLMMLLFMGVCTLFVLSGVRGWWWLRQSGD